MKETRTCGSQWILLLLEIEDLVLVGRVATRKIQFDKDPIDQSIKSNHYYLLSP